MQLISPSHDMPNTEKETANKKQKISPLKKNKLKIKVNEKEPLYQASELLIQTQ